MFQSESYLSYVQTIFFVNKAMYIQTKDYDIFIVYTNILFYIKFIFYLHA